MIIVLIIAVISVVWIRTHIRKPVVAWKENFNSGHIPKGWKVQGKPGTKQAVFSVQKENGDSFLRVEADNASASLMCQIGDIDLDAAPMLKWKWRAVKLPVGADGRNKHKDDQAIGIYVGTGSVISNKSIAYRWDTDAPKGTEGKASYGGGMVKVKWITLRNQKDMHNGKWVEETRNCAEDFKKAWDFIPKRIYLAISSNSQYTGTEAIADLDWVEFTAGNNHKEKSQP